MSVKRILENQLHLHDEGNPAWGVSGEYQDQEAKDIDRLVEAYKDVKPKYQKAPKNLAEILKDIADKYASPKKEIIKNKMEIVAIMGKYQITVKKSELDSSTELWLKEEGISLIERWSGSQIDGEIVVDLKW